MMRAEIPEEKPPALAYLSDPNVHEARGFSDARPLWLMVARSQDAEMIRIDAIRQDANPEEEIVLDPGYEMQLSEAEELAGHILNACRLQRGEQLDPWACICPSNGGASHAPCPAHPRSQQPEPLGLAGLGIQPRARNREKATQQIARMHEEARESRRWDGIALLKVPGEISEAEAEQLKEAWKAGAAAPATILQPSEGATITCRSCTASAPLPAGIPIPAAFTNMQHRPSCTAVPPPHSAEGEGGHELHARRPFDPSPQNFFARSSARRFLDRFKFDRFWGDGR